MISSTLNKTIKFEKGVKSTNAAGTPYMAWEEYLTTYANVYASANPVRFEDGEMLTYSTQFTVRYNDKTSVINNKYRIYYNGTYYKIMLPAEVGNCEGMKFHTILYEDD